ncbi:hypothetical protein VTO42DRAFT_221 [Malbranchea cinnamomea]
MPPKFVPRQRKQKHRPKESQPGVSQGDSNALEIIPLSKDEKEARRQKLREELRAQHPKISAKKQKRLDKYIENKLKKDEELALIKKLSKSKVDTSQFLSARQLGRMRHGPLEKRAQPQSEDDDKKRSAVLANHSDESDSEEDALLSRNTNAFQTTVVTPVGSGLKRPLEIGEDGNPIIKRRKRTRKPKPVVQQEPEWEGFDTEDSDAKTKDDEDDAMSSSSESSEAESSAGEEDFTSKSSEEEDETRPKKIRARQSAFKAWAVQQINEAAGFKPVEPVTLASTQPPDIKIQNQKPRVVVEDEPLPPELQVTTGDPNRKAFAVQVKRPDHVQAARLELPVVGEEQKIMEAIHNNSCVVICGATGSGKTTQVPQFLFEAGFGSPESPNPGMIGVTQPRRVAAVSMAKRVADELGEHSAKVSYQIRFDSTVSSNTAIKFMTDGVLMREIAQDFSLSKYSVIVIDEAHERSVNTDILIGMVSRIVDLRKDMSSKDSSVKPLKLVIMSATLRISDFLQNSNLFRHGPPPLVQVEGRQYPVTIHFSRRTHRDYVEEAFRKVSRGHRKLPPGGFLVFLTGQGEIKHLAKKLKQAFRSTHGSDHIQGKVQMSATEVPLETEDIELGPGVQADSIEDDDGSDVEIRGLDNDDDEEEFDQEEGAMESSTKVHVLPLYSQLPTKEQLKVFEPVPEGSRLIVLATNVAETSLTIPGIRYVFDCGRSKEKQYDVATGVQSFQVGWISKASAGQRAGRAGRTGPGHCYRLYSSAVYEDAFLEHTVPEILRTPIEGVVLQMKSMGLHHVVNFPFPTPPDRVALAKAEKLLKNLGALSPDGRVTDTGRHLTLYPLSPRYGKMLQIGHQHGCMPYVIAMVSALSVSELFIQENQVELEPVKKDGEDEVYTNADRLEDTAREQRKKEFNRARRIFSKYDDKADSLRFLAAVCAYSYAKDPEKFCNQMFLRPNAMTEAAQLRYQLSDLVRANHPGLLGSFDAKLPEPSEKQIRALKQITAAGFIDQIAIRADMSPVPPDMPLKPKRAIDVPYLTLFPSREGGGGELDDKAVYIHPSSILARLTPAELPQYLIYSHLQQSAASYIGEKSKVRMFPLTPVSGLQISALAHGTPLLEYGKPIGKMQSLGGVPERRECWVIPSLVGSAGSTGWPLPAKKVVQKKDPKEGWVIERFIT